jgi:hypothetical protein
VSSAIAAAGLRAEAILDVVARGCVEVWAGTGVETRRLLGFLWLTMATVISRKDKWNGLGSKEPESHLSEFERKNFTRNALLSIIQRH